MELSRREAGIHVLVHPVDRRRVLHAHRGRPPGRTGSRSWREALRGVLGAGARGGRGLAADARAHAGADRRAARRRAWTRPRSRRRAALLAWVGRPPLHVPRLPRVRARRASDAARRSRAPGSGCCAAASGHVSTAFAKLPPAVRALALRAAPAGADQGQRALARPPARATSTTSASSASTPTATSIGERRFLGPLHDARLPRGAGATSRCCGARRRRCSSAPGSRPAATTTRRSSRSSTRSRATSCSRSSVDELYEVARGILELGERQRVRLFMRTDRYERFVSCLVFLPRDRFNTANRRADRRDPAARRSAPRPSTGGCG